MAVIYPMPTNVPELVSTGYQRQNTLVYAAMAGHLNLSLTNLDNASAPKVQAGSVFEVNGGLFYVSVGTDETISGSPATGQNYVYAVPNTGGATFQYSATKPVWSAAKGGWYNGNNRAVAKVYYSGALYNNKVALDRQAAMYEMNEVQPAPTSGGALVVTGVVNEVKSITLEPGQYRFELLAGKGGEGGRSGELEGGSGAEGEKKTGSFLIRDLQNIYYALGGDGNDGADGKDGRIDGGGGGCSGGSAFIYIINNFFMCLGGSGGGGAGGDDGGSGGGGGGGGGYGIGGNGSSGNGYRYGGIGGNNGGGGNGGSGGGTNGGGGGGGSGYAGGGAGGDDGGNGIGGGSGGGYGIGGGSGGGIGGGIGSGGAGGSSVSGEISDPQDKLNRSRIQYQGGGGGGHGIGYGGGYGKDNDGYGGGGLKDTSSGYLRIYRVA